MALYSRVGLRVRENETSAECFVAALQAVVLFSEVVAFLSEAGNVLQMEGLVGGELGPLCVMSCDVGFHLHLQGEDAVGK